MCNSYTGVDILQIFYRFFKTFALEYQVNQRHPITLKHQGMWDTRLKANTAVEDSIQHNG